MQVYISDNSPAEQAAQRIRNDERNGEQSPLRADIMERLQLMLERHNPLVPTLKTASQRLAETGRPLKLLLSTVEPYNKDRRRYNRPRAGEVAVLIEDGYAAERHERDIIIECQSGELRRVTEDSSQYAPLRFVLILPLGSQGWTRGMPKGVGAGFLLEYRSPQREHLSPSVQC